jgi:spermidine synthase
LNRRRFSVTIPGENHGPNLPPAGDATLRPRRPRRGLRPLIPWEVCGRERTSNGRELVLYRRGAEFVIRVGSQDLMWSGSSFSEEEMARVAIARLRPRRAPRVLIGGLGMGFTTRAALDALPADAHVIVAEIVPAVVAWNQGPLAHLAGRPLLDPRTRVEMADVGRVIADARERFDAILLDVDNGPRGLTRKSNQRLYGEVGLDSARRALRPGGILAVWSASASPAFEAQLRKAKFQTDTVKVRARGAHGGSIHSLFFGRVPDLI